MMQVNIQHLFDEQKANFDPFNELKTLISSIILRILNIYEVKKQRRASIREGASIRINTVLVILQVTLVIVEYNFKMIETSYVLPHLHWFKITIFFLFFFLIFEIFIPILL